MKNFLLGILFAALLGASFFAGTIYATKRQDCAPQEYEAKYKGEVKFGMDIFVPDPEDVIIAPDRVWQDDESTYLDFGPKVRMLLVRPVVFIKTKNGKEIEANTRIEGPDGRIVVVETKGEKDIEIILRSGKRVVFILPIGKISPIN